MVPIASPAFLLATVCAALMGFAIQRGATCTVAAVGEVVHKGSAYRIIALAEASLWVTGGLLIALALGYLPRLPGGYAFGYWTLAGAILLGLGAFINQACVFGAIARLGSGQWAFALTPAGFYLGALSAPILFDDLMPKSLESLPVGSRLPIWLLPVFVLFVFWRVKAISRRASSLGEAEWRRYWAPHESTIMIGIAFVIMLIAVGPWSYMDLLIDLARGMDNNPIWYGLLFLALLLGAVTGGWVAGDLSWRAQSITAIARCIVGGIVMGWGSLLVPGSNDGLLLVGMPLLWPYAWISVLTMCMVIWLAFKLELRLTSTTT